MRKEIKNPSSQYRAITWNWGAKTRGHELGQWVQSDKDKDGMPIKSCVYSIDDTSFKPDGTTSFVRRFTIQLITEEGIVFDWYIIENPVNITLMSNHSEFVQI